LTNFVLVSIGGTDDSYNYKKKVEHLENGVWSVKTDFPFVTSDIHDYSVASFEESLFIFDKLDLVF